MPVAHRADLQIPHRLLVALVEKLIFDSLHPQHVERERFGRVGQVAAVNDAAEQRDAQGVMLLVVCGLAEGYGLH